MMKRTDIAIVGAGPIGLFATFYAGMRGLSVSVIDALPEPGGQISALYPEKLIRDVAGFPAVKGRELVQALTDQAKPFSPNMLLGRSATALTDRPNGDFTLGLSDGTFLEAGAVVITGGIGTFTPRKLPCGEDFLNRGLRYFVHDPDEMSGSRVLIVGGGDSAFDWAEAMQDSADVTLVHRRDAFRAHQHTVDQVLAGRSTVHTNTTIEQLRGDSKVTGAVLRNVVSGETTEIDCDHVVAALGFVANPGPLLQWDIEVRDRKIVVDAAMRTSRPGVFAAGDICTYSGRVPLIAVGFGEAATAINHAAVLLDPTASTFPGHSTDGPAGLGTPLEALV
ncbi:MULTISPECIES: NAD(P)/FAD-dependent oxidoreductase [Rhodococcus]|uniref:Ferredoxin--NADP reductase n=2 Tax=Rhodococcus oxybenzonivorans TaxID=1990687 RepID=A0AAE4UYJ0_9NOCA|nr:MULTISPECIES: NAD(P)/FAD-dependent oxidoreductase [Rhodococcus]MDV7241795.1 NAD(P)/FAD-dependent oxidoreductase [Rhodococcus oxybenzonivorans]MDV7265440.1 NAD(P)/FAD-dependent oxidoreductase [Rhodococcus oxybenzonivorans]MDV7273671.1 NAD(P)/FAD-dependent oxidoreductase [Rhodococcus oxybenzonivorans]MDV7343496.1 NAD(P)/FAD-dependent oxidoreductase [Rhodococcus oxybenzonivorans]MDV8027725.1 NAD(P)/FAD-dependent oxidoreductase [Rhodococcus sp. IEGM 27]